MLIFIYTAPCSEICEGKEGWFDMQALLAMALQQTGNHKNQHSVSASKGAAMNYHQHSDSSSENKFLIYQKKLKWQ